MTDQPTQESLDESLELVDEAIGYWETDIPPRRNQNQLASFVARRLDELKAERDRLVVALRGAHDRATVVVEDSYKDAFRIYRDAVDALLSELDEGREG